MDVNWDVNRFFTQLFLFGVVVNYHPILSYIKLLYLFMNTYSYWPVLNWPLKFKGINAKFSI